MMPPLLLLLLLPLIMMLWWWCTSDVQSLLSGWVSSVSELNATAEWLHCISANHSRSDAHQTS